MKYQLYTNTSKNYRCLLVVISEWFVLNKLMFSHPSWMFQHSEFVWTLRSSVWVVFNNFLLIDAADRTKISSDQNRLFFTVSIYPLSFFANTPFIVSTGTAEFGSVQEISYYELWSVWLLINMKSLINELIN